MKVLIPCVLSIIGVIHSTIVKIPELGEIQGSITFSAWTNRTISQFLGVKFARSPSGNRRFMPPEPELPWNDIYNATYHRQSCPQISKMDELLSRPPGTDVEDCLTLNIFTSNIPGNNTTLYPVMVYIHGGGFYEGSAKQFPPNYILENNVLLVVPQYRLGPLGFLSLDTDEISGNVGLMDQVLALEWINKHIKHFGGDNTQITVFGQSSGGCSISLHLLSPMVQPHLFQKAIIQSGASYGSWAIDENPLNVARAIYRTITNTTESFDVVMMENVFKNISVVELFLATLKNYKETAMSNGLVSRAVVQKAGNIKYLTKRPVDYLSTGEFRTVPMMGGVTKNEGTYAATVIFDALEPFSLQNNDDYLRNNLTAAAIKLVDIEDDTGSLVDILNNKYFKEIFDQPKNITFADIAPGISDILGVFSLKGQILKQIKVNSKYEPNDTYLYTFDYKGEHTMFGYGEDTSKYPFGGGVTHSDDYLYLFPYHYTPPLNAADTKVAKLMTDLWANFAINSKPSSSQMNVEWPPVQKNKNGPYLHIDFSPRIGDDFVDCEYMVGIEE